MQRNNPFRIIERDRVSERHKRRAYITLALLLLAVSIGAIVLLRVLTGYAVLQGKAGEIMQVNLQLHYNADIWQGFYGLAFRVPSYTQQQSAVAVGGTVYLQHLAFDCLKTNDGNIPELYASTSQNIDWDSVESATPDMVDSYLEVQPDNFMSASNTFTGLINVMLGNRNITNIPAAHTKKFGAPDSTDFDIGILRDSKNNLIYVTHVTPTYTKGFNNQTINYQLMVPVKYGTQPVYYFFSDPYDECPMGQVALTNSTIYGRVLDNKTGLPLENVTINILGATVLTNATGDYNITIYNGTYTLVAMKEGYFNFIKMNLILLPDNMSTNESENVKEFNFSLEQTFGYDIGRGNLTGTVTDVDFGIPLVDVSINVFGATAYTNISGKYFMEVPNGNHTLIAIKEGYETYYTQNVTVLNQNTTEFNFSMKYYEPPMPLPIPGYPKNTFVSDILTPPVVQRPQIILTHTLDLRTIDERLKVGSYLQRSFTLTSYKQVHADVLFSIIGNAAPLIKIDKQKATLEPRESENFTITIMGNVQPGIYEGAFLLSGDLEDRIPIKIVVYEKERLPIEALLLDVTTVNKIIQPGNNLDYKVSMNNLLKDNPYNITLTYNITSRSTNSSINIGSETRILETQLAYLKSYKLPKDIPEGEYFLDTKADFLDLSLSTKALFFVKKPLYMYALFGFLPLWQLFIIIITSSLLTFAGMLYKRRVAAGRRYGVAVDFRALPVLGRLVRVGRFAEYGRDFWFDLDGLTTHCIVAGATGSGKSVAAQVLVEEALRAGVAVVVFDPTAQWSGFLRACSDREMLRLYSSFGLRRSDARGFSGNVRQVLDAREVFDVRRFMRAGEVEILSLNRLKPEEIDVFVANTVRSVFEAGLDEFRGLRLLLVYDEVHRLLPRFGGSGEGFVQIERACREFRKWGVGVVLISQVLSDFVGEIKANISTELQMRTRDEGDLGRVRVKFGDSYLRGLVRASVGTGMFENPVYNGGRPFFVSFRPLLHSVVRLSDGELAEYNRFNGVLDDLEFEVSALEKLGVDVFDLRLELKLAGDKLRVGGFGMVDVYLEGLVPRVRAEFEKLKKPVPKRVVARLSDEQLAKDKAIAEKEKKEAKEKEKKQEAEPEKNDAKKSAEQPKPEKPSAAKKPDETAESHEQKNEPAPKAANTRQKPVSQKKKDRKKVNSHDKKARAPKVLSLKDGEKVSSIQELKSALKSMKADTFHLHLNFQKNDFADWVESELKNKKLASRMRRATSKKEMMEMIKDE